MYPCRGSGLLATGLLSVLRIRKSDPQKVVLVRAPLVYPVVTARLLSDPGQDSVGLIAASTLEQNHVKDIATKKQLTHDWVFGGSELYDDPSNPHAPKVYAANGGDVICVANFGEAMLDLPIPSSDHDLDFEAFTEHIPALDTPVLVILEPVLPPKKK